MLTMFIKIKWHNLYKMLSPRSRIQYARNSTLLFYIYILLLHVYLKFQGLETDSLPLNM